MIQNRITMVTCSQPSSSKWCWSGAIRNTRCRPDPEDVRSRSPRRLKKPTCTITDSVITTNRPPRISSSSSVRVRIAKPASAPPSDSEPVSPMKIAAGRGVPPQEAEAGPGDRRRDHREVERVAHLVAGGARGDRAALVVLPDVDQRVGAEDHHAGAGGEAVEPVGEVHGVAGAGDDHPDEQRSRRPSAARSCRCRG